MAGLWECLKGIICYCELPDSENAIVYETIDAQINEEYLRCQRAELERVQQNTILRIESETRLSQNNAHQNGVFSVDVDDYFYDVVQAVTLSDDRLNAHRPTNVRKPKDIDQWSFHSVNIGNVPDAIVKEKDVTPKKVQNAESTTSQVRPERKKSSHKNAHKSKIHRVEDDDCFYDVIEPKQPIHGAPVKQTSAASNNIQNAKHLTPNKVANQPISPVALNVAELDMKKDANFNDFTSAELKSKSENCFYDVIEPKQPIHGAPIKQTSAASNNIQNAKHLTPNKVANQPISPVALNVAELDMKKDANFNDFTSAELKSKSEKKKRRTAVVDRKTPDLFSVPQTGTDLYSEIIGNDTNFVDYLDGVYYNECHESSSEFRMIKTKFMRTTQKHFHVTKIEKIFNPFLKASYELRKKEYELMYGTENVKEILLFHGTKSDYIMKIISKNLDWRLTGTTKGHIFGQGVSLTPISNYASNYCDKGDRKKFMLVLNVITCFSCIGSNDMKFPPPCPSARLHLARYDTSSKRDGHVLVKYRDDEFYPSYLITYKGSTIKKNQ